MKTSERRQRQRSGVFTVNVEQISYIALAFTLLTLNEKMPHGVMVKKEI